MKEPWLDDFLNNLPAPSPSEQLIATTQKKMRQLLLQEQQVPEQPQTRFNLYIAMITLVTVPWFLFLNYTYYLALQNFLPTLLPPTIVQMLMVIFIILVTLVGALCYSTVPLWTAYYLRHLARN